MIPVILIHKGHSDYLRVILEQARQYNQQVILLGDSPLATEPIDAYMRNAKEFAACYKHMSGNYDDFELFCFQRWFILNEYMISNGVPVAFYQDSDVMLYADVEKEWVKRYAYFDITLVQGTCANSSFFTQAGLSRFCKFAMATYANRNKLFLELERIYQEMRDQGRSGGICDMTLFRFYRETKTQPIGEMTDIVDNVTWDHHLRASDGYRMREEDGHTIKDIVFLGGFPHVYHLNREQNIRFNSLHFQGQTKPLIERYATK
jgi:hypothetical protein